MPENNGADTCPIQADFTGVSVAFYAAHQKLRIARVAQVAGRRVSRESLTLDMAKMTKADRKNFADAIAFAMTTDKEDFSDETQVST